MKKRSSSRSRLRSSRTVWYSLGISIALIVAAVVYNVSQRQELSKHLRSVGASVQTTMEYSNAVFPGIVKTEPSSRSDLPVELQTLVQEQPDIVVERVSYEDGKSGFRIVYHSGLDLPETHRTLQTRVKGVGFTVDDASVARTFYAGLVEAAGPSSLIQITEVAGENDAKPMVTIRTVEK